jgi:hypothetical protein
MRQDQEFSQRKRKPTKDKSRRYFDDDGYTPSKKALQSQYKRKQKHKNFQNWDSD